VRVPAASVALPILLGTLLGRLIVLPAAITAALLVVLCGAALVAGGRRPGLFLAFASLGFTAGAWCLSSDAIVSSRDSPLRRFVLDHQSSTTGDQVFELEGKLRADAGFGETGVRLSVSVNRISASGLSEPVAGGVVLTVGGSPDPDAVLQWRKGRTVRLTASLRRPGRHRNRGVPDNELSLARRDTTLVGSVKSALLVEVLQHGNPLDEGAASARAFVRRAIGESTGRWSGRSAAIVTAILIGDRVGLGDEVELRLQEAGTYHVIAISGGNVAILAGLLLVALRFLRVPPRSSTALAIVLLSGYALVVGSEPSVTRATAMAVVYLSARLFDHKSSSFNALCLATALIVVAAPLTLFEAGFLLTFGATTGILVGVPILMDHLPSHRAVRAASALFAASIAAEAALLPVGATFFSRVTFAGLVLNFAAIPLMTVVQVAGLFVLALTPVHAAARCSRRSGFQPCM
jgi:competence protein ComEC